MDLKLQVCNFVCMPNFQVPKPISTKVVVTFYLILRNEFQPFTMKKAGLRLADSLEQPIRGLVFGGKWQEFISLSQIKVTSTTLVNDNTIY